MSDDDESITTEEMNQVINEETFEEVEVKGVERKTYTKKVPVVKTETKPKEKKPMSEAKKKAIEKLVENNKKRAEQRRLDKEQGKPVKEMKPKQHTKEIIGKKSAKDN